MSQEKNVTLVNYILVGLGGFFSFIASMLAFFTDFGAWNVGYPWNYYFFIGSETAPIWAQFILFIFAFSFLVNTILAVLTILSLLGKILPKHSKFLQIGGIILAGITFAFTALMVGFFAIFAAGWWWWLSTSFYGGLIGSLLTIIFYVLSMILKPPTETVA
jgi:hypothetical protein